MRTYPVTVKVTIAFLRIVAIIWVSFGIAVIGNLHRAFPEEPVFRWVIGIAAIIAGLVIGGLTFFLWKRKYFAWWLLVAGLFAFSLATFLDQVGWVDLIVLLITVITIILLIKDRHWYLEIRQSKEG